jgi:K+-sensing histidine kinase KdpD
MASLLRNRSAATRLDGMDARMVLSPVDHSLLEQALSNLVDNAIPCNHAGGHVAVLLDEPRMPS